MQPPSPTCRRRHAAYRFPLSQTARDEKDTEPAISFNLLSSGRSAYCMCATWPGREAGLLLWNVNAVCCGWCYLSGTHRGGPCLLLNCPPLIIRLWHNTQEKEESALEDVLFNYYTNRIFTVWLSGQKYNPQRIRRKRKNHITTTLTTDNTPLIISLLDYLLISQSEAQHI